MRERFLYCNWKMYAVIEILQKSKIQELAVNWGLPSCSGGNVLFIAFLHTKSDDFIVFTFA